MSAHHPLGPSASARWLNCPGSVAPNAAAPDEPSKFAAEGSVAHALSEWCREQGKPAAHWIGTEVTHDGFTFTVDAAMADHVQSFVDYCASNPGDMLVEEKFSLDPWVPDGFGRADDIRIDERSRTIYVTDLKYGQGVRVEAEGNTQAMLYALGVVNTLGFMYDVDGSWTVVNTIHQPRLDNVSVSTMAVKDILQWADDVVYHAARLALKKNAPMKAGAWCRWCVLRNTCGERARHMMRENLEDFEVIPEEEIGRTLTAEQVGKILDAARDIKAWLTDIETEAYAMLARGERPVGAMGPYKLVSGRGGREWVDEGKTLDVLSELLEPDQMYTRKLITPAQAEKILGKRNDTLSRIIVKKEGKPTLAPASDKRPERESGASDFTEEVSDEG